MEKERFEMNISNEVIKFIASSILAIIKAEKLGKDEIVSTLELWAKDGWADAKAEFIPKHNPEIGVFTDTTSNFHPYECEPDKCIHCKGTVTKEHNPKTCALCNFNG